MITYAPGAVSSPTTQSYDLDSLVVQAFLVAKRRGKPEWRRMKVAVLKNRLLQLSRNAFRESAHGSSSFRQFVQEHLGHKVDLQGDEVVLREEPESAAPQGADAPSPPVSDPRATAPVPPSTATKLRVRRDLWQSLVDYSSGIRYAWDPELKQARVGRDGDRLFMPTLEAQEYGEWRKQFATEQSAATDLARWVSGRGGMKELPFRFRGEWSAFLRGKIEERLSGWFAANAIEAPAIIEQAPAIQPAASPGKESALRKLVMNCVRVMTEDELSRVPLSAATILRARALGAL